MLEYRVLGAVSVVDGDVEVGVGGPRQRRLAAALLIDRNRVLSVDRLLDVVFEGEPPPGAPVTLRSYVARLRRVVERPEAGSRLAWRPPGYVLEVADDALDVARFEAAVSAGRAHLARGDAAGASQVLRSGLALWRGLAYAEFAEEDWARPEVQRLGELRLTAFELLADADLACGRAGEVASEMEALASEHPLREGFQSRLMLALYRSGRQVDALRVFQAHREVLADELGLDPTPSLAELEGQILAHDVVLLEADVNEGRLRGYRLGERLGTGRDGTVFAARLPGVERDIAIRVMPEGLADDPELVRCFDADARRVAALGHPAVVPLHDWWREPGAAYVVMRRMRGGSLRDRLARGPLPYEELGSIVSRVGGALVAAAAAGITHGRVVAESVLFDDAGHAHLGDFPLGSSGTRVPGKDVRDLAVLVVEALTGERLSEPTLDAVPPALSSVLRPALSDAHPPATEAFVSSVLRAVSEGTAATAERRTNPYKGLRAFDEPDAAEFFGRDDVVEEILTRLSASEGRSRMVLVVGGSGSGKSSVVRAGLLPRVRAAAAGGGPGWFVATMTPGANPFDQLSASLRQVAVVDADGVAAELASSDDGIDRVVRRVVPEGGQLLLVVDQLEELFTLSAERTQRGFLDALVHAVSVPDSRLCVVATLRADFYDRPLRFERFGRAVGESTVPIAAMSAAELEAAIEGPARGVGGSVEPALVAELIGAVLHQPAALPSLQYTLYELAERCADGVLTLSAYRELGGLDAAIAARAEELYLSLDDDGRAAVRRLFGRLVVVAADGEPTRRRALRGELSAVAPGPLEGWLQDVVEAWADARLLTLDRHPESRQPTVEIAHEALLREWPRLRDWLADDREDLVALGQLREAAATWVALDRDAGSLYRGARLDTALDLAERGAHPVLPVERELLDASRAERDRERQAEVDQMERTARANRQLRRQLVALGVLLVAAMVVGVVAVGQRNEANQQRRVASARELAAAATASLDVDPERGVLLALEAVDRTRRSDGSVLPEAEQALHDALVASRAVGRVDGLGGTTAWSPDGVRLAAADPEGRVQIVDARTGQVRRTLDGHADPVNGIAFSPDGALLGTTGEDGFARLWDLATGEELRRFASPEGRDALAPSFSPDASLFAVSWWMEGLVHLVDVETGRVVREIDVVDLPLSTSFHPSGDRMLIANGFGDAYVVDVATGEEVLSLDQPATSAAAWSPDGASVATADEYGRGRVFAAESGRLRAEFAAHRDRLTDIRWSPDSRRIVTASEDGSAKVWQVSGFGVEELFTLTAQVTRSGLATASFSPDGARIATGSVARDAMILWDVTLSGGTELATLPAVAGLSNFERSTVAFTDDGRHILIGNADGAVDVWDARSFTAVGTLGAGTPYRSTTPDEAGGEPQRSTGRLVNALDASPDGRLVAASTPDLEEHPVFDATTTLRVWDIETGKEVFAVPTGSYVDDVAWSWRGDLLAYSTTELEDEETARGWVTVVDRDGRQVARFADEEPFVQVLSIGFTPDDERIVGSRSPMPLFARYFGEVRAWDWRTGEVDRRIDTGGITAALSPSGETLASVTADYFTASEEVELWDAVSGAHEGTLAGHTGAVGHVAFDPSGGRVASSSADGTIRVWDVAAADEVAVLRGHRGRVTSAAFSPDGDRLASISADGTVRVWALDLDELIDLAEQRVTRDLTDDECRRHLHVERC